MPNVYCTKCGKKFEGIYCPACGTKANSSSDDKNSMISVKTKAAIDTPIKEKPVKVKKRSHIPLIITSSLLAVVIIIAGAFTIAGSLKSKGMIKTLTAAIDHTPGNTLDYYTVECKWRVGKYNYTITVSDKEKPALYGDYIIDIMRAVNQVLEEDKRGTTTIIFGSQGNQRFVSGGYYGRIYDYRDGTERVHNINSGASLEEYFPAVKAKLKLDRLPAADREKYVRVTEKLDSDYSRSEDDILRECAMEYGTTVDELKQFMKDTMNYIYS